jgi:hypothetical protein
VINARKTEQSMKKFLQFGGRGPAAAPAAAEPPARHSAGGYDGLAIEEILSHLADLPAADLAKLGDHERTHQNRAPVLARIDALLDNEPWPGYDELDVTGVRSGLSAAGPERLATVLAYERAHKNRAGVVLATQQHPASDG